MECSFDLLVKNCVKRSTKLRCSSCPFLLKINIKLKELVLCIISSDFHIDREYIQIHTPIK